MNTNEITSRLEYKLLQGKLDQDVTGLCFDSRHVKQGDIFVCIRGAVFDSHDALEQIDAGHPSLIIVDLLLSLQFPTLDTPRLSLPLRFTAIRPKSSD